MIVELPSFEMTMAGGMADIACEDLFISVVDEDEDDSGQFRADSPPQYMRDHRHKVDIAIQKQQHFISTISKIYVPVTMRTHKVAGDSIVLSSLAKTEVLRISQMIRPHP